MSEPIISVSGLRGVVGDSLTPDIAARFAAAFLAGLPAGPIVVTRDSRPSGAMLAAVIHQTVLDAGRGVIDAGIAATPTTGVLVRQLEAAGAIQISASHNPIEYNGLKLFDGSGRVIPACAGELVLERYASGAPQCAAPDAGAAGASVQTCGETTERHLALVLSTVDAERIRARRFRVVLDVNHGAGGALGRRLLESLGCQTTVLGETPDGQFAHPPEPTAENVAPVCQHVREAKVDVGFCQDPDADRLAIIDEQGAYPGEEYTLALCLDHVLRRTPGPVVANCATSSMTAAVAEKHGAPFFRTAVGEANVVDKMLAENAIFGGEGNGGPIDPRVGYVRDSFVGMALVLDVMAQREEKLSRLADELPTFAICKTKVSMSRGQVDAAFDRLEQAFADAAPDRLDGLRLDWRGKWLLVRASNTEPIVRIIAEAATSAEATEMCNRAAAVLSDA